MAWLSDLGLTNTNTSIHIVTAVLFGGLSHFALVFTPEVFHDIRFLLVSATVVQRTVKCRVCPGPNGRNIPIGKLPCSFCIT